jgi:hypothetical protein
LQAGEAAAENPDDLIEATPRELKSVIVTTSDPALRVNLLRRAADVSTTQTSAEARAMVDDVHGLLRRRRSPWPGLGRTLALPLVYAAIFLVIGVQNAGSGKPLNWPLVAVTAGVLALYAAWDAYNIGRAGAVVLIPERRGTRRGLSAQTRSSWLVALVSAFLGVVATVLVGWWQIRSQK